MFSASSSRTSETEDLPEACRPWRPSAAQRRRLLLGSLPCDAMLVFSRIRNVRRGNTLAETGPSAGGPGGSNNPAPAPKRRRKILGRMPQLSERWRRQRERRRPVVSGIRMTGAPDPISSPDEMNDPMESFSPVTDNALDGAVSCDEVPIIIADKIQKHHELWYHLAYGRPRDRRVSGGYALQPAKLGGQPLPRPNRNRQEGSGLTPVASWKSRPRLWSDIGTPDTHASAGHRPISSIDYGNAGEVVLSNTQDADEDMLKKDDTLPVGSPSYLLHPYDKRKVAWDLFVACLIVYGCINIPLRIGFDLSTNVGQIITDSFIDVVFLSDIIVSFRTAYLAPDGEPVTNLGDIAIRYLKGSFTIDVCSTIPVDLIMLAVGGTSDILRSTKLLRTLRLLRLARLMKLSKIGGKEDELRNFLHPSLWALIKMFVSLIFIAHIMGCMWNWLIILSPDDQTWAVSYGVEETSWEHRYLVGVYWAFTTMTTVGYGDITSASDLERIFAIVGMIIGATVFGYIIGNVAVIMENFNVVDAIESGKMNQVKDWLYDRKFPPVLADKIRRQYRYIFSEIGVFDNSEIVEIMPGVMSTSLLYAHHRAVAKGVGFLAKRPPVLVGRLLRKMVPCFANSGDVLYLEHEVGGHWYILRAGTISFYVSVSPLETQSEVLLMRSMSGDGNFGLTPVLLNVLNRETATATTAAELLTVRKDDLVDILRQWPEVMAELTVEAERLFKEVQKFRADKRSAAMKVLSAASLAPPPEKTLADYITKSRSTTFSESPDVVHPPADSNITGGETQAGGGESSSTGSSRGGRSDNDGGRLVEDGEACPREDENKQAEAVDCDVGAVEGGFTAAVGTIGGAATQEARGQLLATAPGDPTVCPGTAWDPIPETEENDVEKGGRNFPARIRGLDEEGIDPGEPPPARRTLSPSSAVSSLVGAGSAGGSGRESGGEEERRAARQAEAAEAVKAGIGFDGSFSSTCTEDEEHAKATAAARAAAANETPPAAVLASAPRGRAAERLRPPPIRTADVPGSSRGLLPTAEVQMSAVSNDNDNYNDVDEGEGRPVDPEVMRGCFVAKTFSPSDLGLGALGRGGGSGDDGGHSDVPEAMTKASLMRARRRRRTINKGVSGIEDRKQSVDEVLGLDDQQAVLGSVPPARLFSITGMFHPEAPVKVSWDLWLSMVIVWSVLEVTYRLGFNRPAQDGWLVFSYVVDGLFFTDMLVSLRTALTNRDGELVANQKQVAVAYLKGWFLVDLVSTVPWDVLVLKIAVGNPSAATSTKLVRALRLVRLVRLVRLLKIPDFMEEWEYSSPLGPSSIKLGRLLIIMAFSAHVNACVWYAAGLHTGAERNWIADYYCSEDGVSIDCPDSKQSFSLYLTSIYFAFTTMTTTGYGDILPNRLSVLELTVAIVSEVLGATIFAWVIGNLVNLVLNLNPAERNRKSMMNYLTEYIREVPLNAKAKQAMARNYAFHLQIHSVFNQPSILGDLLPHLQNQAYMFLWRSLMPKLPFFCAMEDQVTGFVRVVLPLLKPATFALGEVIVTPKIGTREMGFIMTGEVEVRLAKGRRNYKTTTMGERRHFGEMFMLLPEHVPFRGLAQVRATIRVRMMTLTRTAFSILEDRHPHVSDFIAKQLYEPRTTPLWVVVSADFQCEVDKLEANTMVSDSSTLQTPRSPEGSFLEPVTRSYEPGSTLVTSPGGTIQMRKRVVMSRSPSSSPIGVAAPREPAARKAVGGNKASRMASGRIMPPHAR